MASSSAAYAAAKLSRWSAAVGHYNSAVLHFADGKPAVPVQLHFGAKDGGIPLSDVGIIKARRPEVDVPVYPGAQHGFKCDERASHDKPSAEIAWQQTLDFFGKNLK